MDPKYNMQTSLVEMLETLDMPYSKFSKSHIHTIALIVHMCGRPTLIDILMSDCKQSFDMSLLNTSQALECLKLTCLASVLCLDHALPR